MLCSPFIICGWLVIGLAQNKIMLYVGRVISAGKNIKVRTCILRRPFKPLLLFCCCHVAVISTFAEEKVIEARGHP